MDVVTLTYDNGSILIHGGVGTPYGRWDPRINAFRAMALHYREILEYLEGSGVEFRDSVPDPPPCPGLSCRVRLRPYQREGLEAWFRAGRRGVIVLPTGAGKTFIAFEAIRLLGVSTLVIVPTLDLMEQWRRRLVEAFDVEVGVYGGGEEVLRCLTVATYDSAYMKGGFLGNKFMFIVFDEVHHLPAPSYSQIGEMYVAPYRMGLTATPEREDGMHRELPRLVGDIVYRVEVDALAGKHLAPYGHEKLLVDLTPEERRLYDEHLEIFRDYLRRRGLAIRSIEDFQRFIMRSGGDRDAREALLARNRAVKIALNSEAKMSLLESLLERYRGEKILIFTLHNQLVYRISRRFLVPAITYQTAKEERREILERFRRGEYRVIATSQVLDEGIDVPDASIGIIISGTGSTREYIQRLGRLLRKVRGKEARLIEIVARDTVEARMSTRRRRSKLSRMAWEGSEAAAE
ncbi:MAG: DEAD/DEAH box helicase family protein [Candidatus Bathyarchaeia archaeon]